MKHQTSVFAQELANENIIWIAYVHMCWLFIKCRYIVYAHCLHLIRVWAGVELLPLLVMALSHLCLYFRLSTKSM